MKQAGLIRDVVAEVYDVETKSLVAAGRMKTQAEARQAYMLMLRELLKLSLPEIGLLVDRDHTTVLQGIRSLSGRAKNDTVLARKLKHIRSQIKLRAKGTPLGDAIGD